MKQNDELVIVRLVSFQWKLIIAYADFMPVAKVWYGRMTILTELIKRIYLLARYGNGFINIDCDFGAIWQ